MGITDARPQARNLRGAHFGKRRVASDREDDIDCFRPIPIIGTLNTSGWGIGTSGLRDPGNGIEDMPNWRYWDGKVIKANDGKHHLFFSKWQASKGIAVWMSDSVSVHPSLGPIALVLLVFGKASSRLRTTRSRCPRGPSVSA